VVFARVTKMLLQPLQGHSSVVGHDGLSLPAGTSGISGRDIVDNLNQQFDAQMSTLVVLAHLHALARMQQAVLAQPLPTAAASSESGRSSRKKKSSSSVASFTPRTPQERAVSVLRSTLSPHFPLLSLHAFQALKDYAVLASLGVKKVGQAGLQGYYFAAESGSAPATVRLYRDRAGTFLSNLCAQVSGTGGAGSSALSLVVASDGSVGSPRAQRELVAVCVGIIALSLQSVAAAEQRASPGGLIVGAGGGAGMILPASSPMSAAAASPTGNGVFMLRSFSHADPKRVLAGSGAPRAAGYDGRAPEEVTREVVACLGALRDLFSAAARPLTLRADAISPTVLLELLPWLGWLLAHRPAALEGTLIGQRQRAMIQTLQGMLQALAAVTQDPAALETFVAEAAAAQDTTIDGTGGVAPSPMLRLCGAFAELLSSSLFAMLPVPTVGGSGEGAAYTTALLRLADPSAMFLPPEAEESIKGVCELLAPFVAWARGVATAADGGQDEAAAHAASATCLVVSLLLHVQRKANASLCSHAVVTLRALLLRSEGSDAVAVVPAVLIEQLATQLDDLLLSPNLLPPGTEWRVQALLGSLYLLSVASLPFAGGATDEQVAQAAGSFVRVWRKFASHDTPRLRTVAFGALLHHVLLAPDHSLSAEVQAHEQRMRGALLAQVGPSIGLAARSAESVEESGLALRCMLALFHSAPLGSSEALMALVLPLAVAHLSRAPEFAADVLVLATQQAPLFKAQVALLPLDYRARLQKAVMALSAEQQAAAVAQAQASATAAAAAQQQQAAAKAGASDSSAKAESSSSRAGKKSKRRSDSSASAQPTIALSMDFSKFGKK